MATKYRQFQITADDITEAIARNSKHCPIAEAIERGLPRHMQYVQVDLGTIRWTDLEERKRYIFITPLHAQQFIVDFDSGKRHIVKPFTLRLKAPAQILDIRSQENNRRHEEKARVRRSRTNKPTTVVNGKGEVTRLGGVPIRENANIQQNRRWGARALKE